ncbi:hypothetical protein WMY93_019034 [Mugilogobius chulae]|uniref:Ig-like domain-containing protein n=1 Tax=Mugilogobius chulae TaxID=88201 RepID=A0AAW0NQ11_9GOBI
MNSVSLSCGGPGLWTVRRNTSTRHNQGCSDWGADQSGSVCSMPVFPEDSGQYWCERNSVSTEPVHITVQDRGVLLQLPVLPVSPGQTVSLTCRHHSGSALPARFYRHGRHLSEQPTGRLSLQQVAVSDAGLYQCEIGGETSRASPLRVKADETLVNTSPPPVQSPVPSVPPAASLSLLLSSIVGSVLLMFLVLLLVFLVTRYKKERGVQEERCVETFMKRIDVYFSHESSKTTMLGPKRLQISDESSVYSTVCYRTVNQTKDAGVWTDEKILRLSEVKSDSEIRVRYHRVLPSSPEDLLHRMHRSSFFSSDTDPDSLALSIYRYQPIPVSPSPRSCAEFRPSIQDYLSRPRPTWEELKEQLDKKKKGSRALADFEDKMNERWRKELAKNREKMIGERDKEKEREKEKQEKRKKQLLQQMQQSCSRHSSSSSSSSSDSFSSSLSQSEDEKHVKKKRKRKRTSDSLEEDSNAESKAECKKKKSEGKEKISDKSKKKKKKKKQKKRHRKKQAKATSPSDSEQD